MAYTASDILLRKMWLTDCIADKTQEYMDRLERGDECLDLKIKLCLLNGFSDVLCEYDPAESYNHLTETQVDNVVAQIESICGICFTGKGLASVS